MELIDNKNKKLRDDLSVEIKTGSKLSIASACFSIYAFQELKKQLLSIDELRFIFTSPTFTTEKAKKEKREFYIPRLNRERSLYGTEFEVKLRNELSQKAIAKECADWIRRKVTFKSNVTSENMMGFINVDNTNYMPIQEFSTVDLGCERGNNAYCMIQKNGTPFSQSFLELFDMLWNDPARLQDVTDEIIENISAAYNENSPDFIYFVTLYNIFNEFLEDISEDVLPNEATGFKDSKIWNMLYNFQKDAALAIINKLEKYNGCILADSVGLGKTFTALAVIKYYENRNKSVLVLCPKKLTNNWNTYKDNYVNNPIACDRLRYQGDLAGRDGLGLEDAGEQFLLQVFADHGQALLEVGAVVGDVREIGDGNIDGTVGRKCNHNGVRLVADRGRLDIEKFAHQGHTLVLMLGQDMGIGIRREGHRSVTQDHGQGLGIHLLLHGPGCEGMPDWR